MTQDESLYPNPSQFKPERFLTVEGKLKPDWTNPFFGFGRRICPGRFLADSSVWAAMVSILTVFQICKAKDSHGREVDVKGDFTIGMAMYVYCTILDRGP